MPHWNKNWTREEKDKANEYFRNWREKNREKIREYNREYNKKWRKKHGYHNEINGKGGDKHE